jgi:hypothetical protein
LWEEITIKTRIHALWHLSYFAAFFFLISPSSRGAPLPACVGSVPISRFRLLVVPAKGGPALPLSEINQLLPGERLKYEPLHLPDSIKEKARVAVLLAPLPSAKSQRIVVLEARPAKDAAEWPVPLRASVAGVVFGPRGLNVKKVTTLVNKDDELIPELAEYAQQTETVQALVQTLTQYEASPSAGRDLNAALTGFSSQYNVDVPKLDASTPTNQQAAALLRAVLPSLATYDPLTAGRPTTVQQTTGLAASVAALFFGTPVGLAAGGTALLTNLHAIMSPDTDFHAAFTQPVGNGLALCAKPGAAKAHSRPAYLWVLRIPDATPPSVSLSKTVTLPLESQSTLEIACASPAHLKLLPRARKWRLVSGHHDVSIPAKVDVGKTQDTLAVDLRKAKLAPGEYRLAADWDWTPLEVAGTVRLHHLGDFSKAKLTPVSEDRLVSGTGTVQIELTGTNFEFVRQVEILPAGESHATPKELSFTLPKGEGAGEQTSLQVELDTSSRPAGAYLLRLTQASGAPHDVAITLHPPNPTLAQLPWRVNLGEPEQEVELHGTALERIESITSRDAQWKLAPVPPGSHDLTQRPAEIKLLPGAKKDQLLDASVEVEGLHAPLRVSDVLRVAGPRPKILGAQASFPQQSNIALQPGEIPSGSAVSFAIQAENVGAQPALALACRDASDTRQAVTLRPGDKTRDAELDFAGQGVLFLSLDPGTVGQSGCVLTASLDSPDTGDSNPYALGHVIRLPRIEKFALSDEKAGETLYLGTLTGSDLQIIAKTGWNAQTGFPVQGIPTPLPGQSGQQTLRIELPWPPPSPRAPLFVWLRGESSGRETQIRY